MLVGCGAGVTTTADASLGAADGIGSGLANGEVARAPPHEASTSALVARNARSLNFNPPRDASRLPQVARELKRIGRGRRTLCPGAPPPLTDTDPHERVLERDPRARLVCGGQRPRLQQLLSTLPRLLRPLRVDLPEQAFFNVGTIEQAREKGERMAKENA